MGTNTAPQKSSKARKADIAEQMRIVTHLKVGDAVSFRFGFNGPNSVKTHVGKVVAHHVSGPGNRLHTFDIRTHDGLYVDQIGLAGVNHPETGLLHGYSPTDKTKYADPYAAKAPSRLDQVVNWVGPDYDGVIAFDESHNAGNLLATKGERGTSEPSLMALAMVALQRRLPNARIVYVSATGATTVNNLAYATRLGLWGDGTPFPSVHNFVAEMTAGGLATMELVARDMKQMGAYLARSLSYDGVSYARLQHDLSPLQRDIYNRLAQAWQVTLQNFEAALALTGATSVVNERPVTRNSDAVSAAKSAFWGAQLRFFNQIITSMQMPSVIEQMHADLKDGKAIVMQLVNTNEAATKEALGKRQAEGEDSLEDLDLTPREQLMQLVSKAFPVVQMQEEMDENGNKVTKPVKDAEGNLVQNRQAVAMRDKLLRDLADIKVPEGPLEIILNEFGIERVAEVTGRTKRVVQKAGKDGQLKATLESRSDASNRADADAFMADKKKILIFSNAGGTGSGAAFSRQAATSKFVPGAPPLARADIDAIVRRVIAVWQGDAQTAVVVTPRFAELPAPILEAAHRQGYDNNSSQDRIPGIAYRGKIYLVQENLPTAELLEETLFHERVHQVPRGNLLHSEGRSEALAAVRAVP